MLLLIHHIVDEHLKFHGLEVLIDYYLKNPGSLSDGIMLKEYIKADPPPHDARRFGRTNLLHRATSQGDYIVVSELLKTGYKHEVKNQDGQTAVHLASMSGKNEILRKLIEYGANVNLRDTASFTPLHVKLNLTSFYVLKLKNCSFFVVCLSE